MHFTTAAAAIIAVAAAAPVNIFSSRDSPLSLNLINKLTAGTPVNVYVTGRDASGAVVFLRPDGTFLHTQAGQVMQAGDIAIPMTSAQQKINIPGFIDSARVWFAEGNLQFSMDPNNQMVQPTVSATADAAYKVNWGFVELSYLAGKGLYANLSYVDFVGLPLGMEMITASGATQTAVGLRPDAVTDLCNKLNGNGDFSGLCIKDDAGNPLRVVAPADYMELNPSAFADYWTSYVDQVWARFQNDVLTIDTQSTNGVVACKVNDQNMMSCDKDNRPYAKPNAKDIFGCNTGPFGIAAGDNDVHKEVIPRLCAAFNRGTLLLADGNTQPSPDPSVYYTTMPHNVYSAQVHAIEADGKGYGFAYDDVTPSGHPKVDGSVAAADAIELQVTIGGQ